MAAEFGDNDATQAPPAISCQDKKGNIEKMSPTKANHPIVKVFQQL